MSIGSGHRLGLFICGFVWQSMVSVASADIVTVDFEGTVTAVKSSTAVNSIVNNIFMGDKFIGTYTYDTTVPDTLGDVSLGLYENSLSELYINFTDKPFYWHLGKHTGGLTGRVETQNVTATDKLTLVSSESSAVSGSSLDAKALQYLQLQFSQTPTSANFLDSDALPNTLPPVSSSSSVCLRFDTTALTTECGAGAADVSLDFTAININRVDRYQWANPLPQGNTLLDVIWNKQQQMYVAVGQNGTIATSANGIAWVNRSVLTTDKFASIAWGNGVYVAVTRNSVFSSKDNIVWNKTDTTIVGSRDRFSKLIWDGSQFVIVGTHIDVSAPRGNGFNLLVDTSPDGFKWMQEFPPGEDRLSNIASNGSLYVGISLLSSSRIVTSTDLKTWTAIDPLPTKLFFDLSWSGSLFVAVGASGSILSSVNGIDWIPQSIMGTAKPLIAGIEWQDNKFIAVGSGGMVLTGSPDGVTWEAQKIAGISDLVTLQATSFNGVEHIVVGDNGKTLLSNNALNWQIRSSGVVDNFNDALWTGSEFVVVGNNSRVGTSENGVDWIFQDSLGTANLRGIATDTRTGTGVHVAVGQNGSIYRSTDPKTTWTLVRGDGSAEGSLNGLNKVLWTGNQFIAVGKNGSIVTSPLGSTWVERANNVLHEMTGIATSTDTIVVVGRDTATNRAIVMTSIDAVSWTTQQSVTLEAMSGLLSVTWSGNEFIAAGGSVGLNDLVRSHDGVYWRAYQSVLIPAIEHVEWIGNQFIGVGSKIGVNRLFNSDDGILWAESPSYFSGEVNYGIANSTGNLIIVSSNGGIKYKFGSYIDNFAPMANAGRDSCAVTGEAVTLSANVSDADGIASMSFSQSKGPGITDTNNDELKIDFITPNAPPNTSFEFTLSVIDNVGVSSRDVVTVAVNTTSVPMNVSASTVDTNPQAGTTVVLNGFAEDPGNCGLSYQWEQVLDGTEDALSIVTLTNANTLNASFVAPTSTVELFLNFRFTATGQGGSVSSQPDLNFKINAVATPAPKPSGDKKGGGALLWLLSVIFATFFIRFIVRRRLSRS